ncbi:MAG: hypothetical protein LUQ50_00455 [Methanospirillum sp.]|uniref:hypothetical protein n=1 Tax=Methanospirillum sp. TaxID=45200 RepID=UPI00236C9910|nr:hypothetical protein [Methanospirillum sp.]MDD1727522.1 hypothetical protein [Methanospirillum sp.]
MKPEIQDNISLPDNISTETLTDPMQNISSTISTNGTIISVDKKPGPNQTLSFDQTKTKNLTEVTPDHRNSVDETDNQATVNQTVNESSYRTVGDIIKAKDWKALGEYQCKMKAENPAYFDDSGPTFEDQEARWNQYFNPPPPVVYYSCCG